MRACQLRRNPRGGCFSFVNEETKRRKKIEKKRKKERKEINKKGVTTTSPWLAKSLFLIRVSNIQMTPVRRNYRREWSWAESSCDPPIAPRTMRLSSVTRFYSENPFAGKSRTNRDKKVWGGRVNVSRRPLVIKRNSQRWELSLPVEFTVCVSALGSTNARSRGAFLFFFFFFFTFSTLFRAAPRDARLRARETRELCRGYREFNAPRTRKRTKFFPQCVSRIIRSLHTSEPHAQFRSLGIMNIEKLRRLSDAINAATTEEVI